MPPLNSRIFAEAILRLAASAEERIRIGEKAESRVTERYIVSQNMAEALRHLAEVVE